MFKFIDKIGSKIGVIAENLTTGKNFCLNENTVFTAASSIKLPVLFALYKLSPENGIDKSLKLSFSENDLVDDSPWFENLDKNIKECNIFDLAHSMITVSDNVSTNLLIDFIGFEKINNVISNELKMKKTFLKRKMCDFEARKRGLENITTPFDMSIFFKHLIKNIKVTPKEIFDYIYSTRISPQNMVFEILKILSEQKDLEKIPSGIKSQNIIVANKPGELPFIRNDSALIITEKEQIIISIFVEDVFNEEKSDELFANLTSELFTFLTVN